VLLGTVVDIDPDSKQVHLEDGAILGIRGTNGFLDPISQLPSPLV
jgi:hypothetical protein